MARLLSPLHQHRLRQTRTTLRRIHQLILAVPLNKNRIQRTLILHIRQQLLLIPLTRIAEHLLRHTELLSKLHKPAQPKLVRQKPINQTVKSRIIHRVVRPTIIQRHHKQPLRKRHRLRPLPIRHQQQTVRLPRLRLPSQKLRRQLHIPRRVHQLPIISPLHLVHIVPTEQPVHHRLHQLQKTMPMPTNRHLSTPPNRLLHHIRNLLRPLISLLAILHRRHHTPLQRTHSSSNIIAILLQHIPLMVHRRVQLVNPQQQPTPITPLQLHQLLNIVLSQQRILKLLPRIQLNLLSHNYPA